MEAEKPITFEGKNYNVPSRWRFLWGLDNENKPFTGKDFELANFADEEVAIVLTKVLEKQITLEQVKTVRDNGKGIKSIDNEISKTGVKAKIVEMLFDNLFEEHKSKNDATIFERPIFKIADKIIELAGLNHPPVDTIIEIENKKQIKKWLEQF